MRHLTLILLTSSFFTACITDTDKALWSEAKETFTTGQFAELETPADAETAVADGAQPRDQGDQAKAKDNEAIEAPQATTGR